MTFDINISIVIGIKTFKVEATHGPPNTVGAGKVRTCWQFRQSRLDFFVYVIYRYRELTLHAVGHEDGDFATCI